LNKLTLALGVTMAVIAMLMIPINIPPNVAKASNCSIGFGSGGGVSVSFSSSGSCSTSLANTHSGGLGGCRGTADDSA
jgi:hypothetical protein